MMKNTKMSLPKWFWAASILALVWNLIGVLSFLGELSLTEDQINSLPEVEQYLYESRPIWVKISYALAVFAGAAGSIALLVRKKMAGALLLLSLISIIAMVFFTFVISDALSLLGIENLILPIIILIIGILLVFFARYCDAKGWLN